MTTLACNPNAMRELAMPRMNEQLYVLFLKRPDDSVFAPIYVRYDDNRSLHLAEAKAFLDRTYQGVAQRTYTKLESNLLDANITDPSGISDWVELKGQLNKRFLAELAPFVSPTILDLLASNLNSGENRTHLIKAIKSSPFSHTDQDAILLALDVATKKHAGQVYAREQDTTGLLHIGYVNHPTCIALKALELGLSPQAIQAALMHDVLEDTDYSSQEMEKMFSPAVVSLVRTLTRDKTKPRSSFLEHISQLEGEAQILKALDRFDNMLRSFGINDPQYIRRVLAENRSVYSTFFRTNSVLRSLAPTFLELHRQLAIYRCLPTE